MPVLIVSKIDFGFISRGEGGQQLYGYASAAGTGKTGVTIATGFDLGAREEKDLIALKLDDDLVQRFTPYLGLQGADAEAFLAKNPRWARSPSPRPTSSTRAP